MESNAKMATIVRELDKDDLFDTITVYTVNTFDQRIKSEIQDRDLTIYVPEICTTAPPKAQKFLLNHMLQVLLSVRSGGPPPTEFVEWVFSRKFIIDYRRILANTNLSFFRLSAITPDMDVFKEVDQAMRLIPDCNKTLRYLVIGVRKVSLDPRMYPVASTSLAGHIIALDPCLLDPDIPPILLRFAVYYEATQIICTYSGFLRGAAVQKAHHAFIKRFPNYEKVIAAYDRLKWFFEWGVVVRKPIIRDRIAGGTSDLDDARGTPVIGVPPCCI